MNDSMRDKPMRSETQISEKHTIKRYFQLIKYIFNSIIHNYSNTQMKVYAKNSFDRLGDDLTELILQYLTFEDKVRLECVSKQWRRLVFNKQFVIEINKSKATKDSLKRNELFVSKSLDRQLLESVLKKCRNITRFSCNFIIDSSLLSLIGQYCRRVKSLTYYSDYNNKNVLLFFQSYGHRLEELNLFGDYEQFEQIFRLCPNLENVRLPYNWFQFFEDKKTFAEIRTYKLY